jgi:hypothetical protein
LGQVDAQMVTLPSAVRFRQIYIVLYPYWVLYIQFYILLFRRVRQPMDIIAGN